VTPATKRGTFLAVAGTLCLVPDSTLVRLVDAGSLTTSAWRGLLTAAALSILLALRYRGRTVETFRAIGGLGLVSAVLWAVNSVLFVASVDRTAVANTLVIISTAPFFAALLSKIALNEPVARRTWLAIASVIAGVLVTFAGSVEAGGTDGDLMAVGVALVVAVNLTLLRRARAVDMVPAAGLGGLLGFVVLAGAGVELSVPADDWLPLLLMGLVFIPAGLALITAGTRHLPSPEVSLILVLETVLGPALAWVVVDEAVTGAAAVGGVIVVATVVAHSVAALRAGTAERATQTVAWRGRVEG